MNDILNYFLDKRAGEVIFFENSQAEDDGKSKRSGKWSLGGSAAKVSADETEAFESVNINDFLYVFVLLYSISK